MKTNRTFRKVAGAATAAVLASCAMVPMAVTNVSAASITIENTQPGHTYEAYQIFKGDLVDGKLSNIEWGAGVNHSTILDAVKALPGFGSCATAADVADVLAGIGNDSAEAIAFAKAVGGCLTSSQGMANTQSAGAYSMNINLTDGGGKDISNGYYLIKDKDDSLNNTHATYTNYIVKVLGNETVTAKSGLPTLEKKVKDINDSTSVQTDFQDSADYDIGDAVPFKITATVDEKLKDYDGYSFIIHDTLSAGLKLNAATLKVQAFDSESDTSGVNVDYTKTDTANGFDIVISNLEDITDVKPGGLIVVTYDAYLGGENKVNASDVVIGSAGNPNTASLEYSNNPNDSSDKGKTPSDKVQVFTYKTVIQKVKDDKTSPLAGAGFTLFKFNGTDWAEVQKIAAGADTEFVFTGLDDGQYKLVEDTAPTGYNKLKEPIYFEISAEHETDSADPQLTSLTATHKTFDEGTKAFADYGTGAIDFTETISDGSVSAKVVNKAGSALPSTGGIGTTPFYIGGGVLVAAAGVYIIVKKRMKHSDNEEK